MLFILSRLYITALVLNLTCNWKFVPFDHFHPILPSLRSPPLLTTNFISFSMILFDIHFFKVQLTYDTVLVAVAQHSDSIFLYISKRITMVSLDNNCHHTKISHGCWLYSPHCTFHTHDSFILQMEVCTS